MTHIHFTKRKVDDFILQTTLIVEIALRIKAIYIHVDFSNTEIEYKTVSVCQS